MHDAAMGWLRTVAGALCPPSRVCDLGARLVNDDRTLDAMPRALFQGAAVAGVDLVAGAGVDVVADAATWGESVAFDLVICTEVLEHTEQAGAIIDNARRLLRPGGVLLLTAAGVGRAPHSAVDGGPLRDGEFYRNVSEAQMRAWLAAFPVALVQVQGEDIYALGVKG